MALTQCVRGGSKEGLPGWLIKFAYDAELIEALKLGVPHLFREWRPDTQTWWVSERYEHVLDTMFKDFKTIASQRPLFEM